MFTRAIGEELRKSLGQPVIMRKPPRRGLDHRHDRGRAKSPPDGYTLLMISATQTTVETLNSNRPYRLMRDLVPVAAVMNSELVLVVPERSPVNSLKELIALAKAQPGTLNYALLRSGLELSHGGRAHQKSRRARHGARPIQRLDRCAHRHSLRPARPDVRQRADNGADDRSRPRQGARHLRQDALAGAARTSQPSRRPGFQATTR